MIKLLEFFKAHEWARIMLTVLLFFIIAIAEGSAYWVAGVATIVYLFWAGLRYFKFV